MQDIRILSPAKINLYLDVNGKRGDGYHDIVTVFEKIDLCDILSAKERSRGIKISSSDASLPCDERNIVHAASNLLMGKYGIDKGVEIHIDKRIPVAAGMGGGSSNAAAALHALNRLWALEICDEELAELGRSLGADVPFFIFNHKFALGSEKGDAVEGIDTGLTLWHTLISPPVKVLSKDVYSKVNLGLTPNSADVKILLRAIENGDLRALKGCLYNRLEAIVEQEVKEIAPLKDYIRSEDVLGMMVSGSGPVIFVLTETRKEAWAIKEKLKKRYVPGSFQGDWKFFVVKTF